MSNPIKFERKYCVTIRYCKLEVGISTTYKFEEYSLPSIFKSLDAIYDAICHEGYILDSVYIRSEPEVDGEIPF